MVGLSLYFDLVAATALVALAFLVIFLIYAVFTYGPVIGRIFEVRPLFLPLRVSPEDLGEAVTFTTDDGLELSGSFLGRRNPQRVGLLVFCHEYLSDRWSYLPYLDHLRDLGYDIFTFDFRNHGSSASDPDYAPLQWATDHEVRDLRAALAYLRTVPIMTRPVSGSSGSAGGEDGPGRGVGGTRRLGRGDRRCFSDPRDDDGVHLSLGRDLRSQPAPAGTLSGLAV